jgi:hypothetical protein
MIPFQVFHRPSRPADVAGGEGVACLYYRVACGMRSTAQRVVAVAMVVAMAPMQTSTCPNQPKHLQTQERRRRYRWGLETTEVGGLGGGGGAAAVLRDPTGTVPAAPTRTGRGETNATRYGGDWTTPAIFVRLRSLSVDSYVYRQSYGRNEICHLSTYVRRLSGRCL